MIAAALLALQDAPIPPPPPMPHRFYGPVRMCTGDFSADLRAGEGLVIEGNYATIHGADGTLGVNGWIYGHKDLRHLWVSHGSVEVAGIGKLERVLLGPPEGPRYWVYLYDSADRGPFPLRQIGSDRFDGTDADLSLIARLVAGAGAKARCADIPPDLRATPEREVTDGFWFDPAAHPGPLTICQREIAFDVEAGEQLLLPWFKQYPEFAVTGAGYRVAVQNLMFPTAQRPLPARGAIAADPRYAIRQWPMVRNTGAARHFYLGWAGEPAGVGAVTGTQISFTIDGLDTDARTAFIHRARVRTPQDKCFGQGPP